MRQHLLEQEAGEGEKLNAKLSGFPVALSEWQGQLTPEA